MCIPWPILEIRENLNHYNGLIQGENIRQISVYDVEEHRKARRKQQKFGKLPKQKYKQINRLKDKADFDNDRKWMKSSISNRTPTVAEISLTSTKSNLSIPEQNGSLLVNVF